MQCWENWTAACKRMKSEQSPTPWTKINSKWIKDLNIKPDTIKLLAENIDKTLFGINHSIIFSDLSHRVMEIRTKINKWDLIKLKSFWTVKETINKTKRQPTEWEKIFAKYINNLYSSTSTKPNNPNQKMGSVQFSRSVVSNCLRSHEL